MKREGVEVQVDSSKKRGDREMLATEITILRAMQQKSRKKQEDTERKLAARCTCSSETQQSDGMIVWG